MLWSGTVPERSWAPAIGHRTRRRQEGIELEATGAEPIATVIVATRNRPGDIVRAVRSVLADRSPLELIVVDQSDDGGTEPVLREIADSDPRFRYLHTDIAGKTRAMNLGLATASAPFVLFTDDDCEVPIGWLETMVAAMAANDRVGGVFCQVVAGPHDHETGFVPVFEVPEETTWTSVWRLAAPEMGAGMGVRRAAVEAIGGFDEHMGPGGRFPSSDDTDIATRLLAGGWHVVDTKRTEVIHHGFRTFEQGRELTKRDWLALGASFGKATRCGLWGATVNGCYLGLSLGLVSPIANAVASRSRPQGLGRLVHFGKGFVAGLTSAVDRDNVLFT